MEVGALLNDAYKEYEVYTCTHMYVCCVELTAKLTFWFNAAKYVGYASFKYVLSMLC